jgi:hypothetical protein
MIYRFSLVSRFGIAYGVKGDSPYDGRLNLVGSW